MNNGKIKNFCRKIFKREDYLSEQAGLCSGVFVVNSSVKYSGTDRFKHACSNALLMFIITSGLTFFVASAFEISYHVTFCLAVYAVLAFLMSAMNIRRAWQNIGYIVSFVLFTAIIITFRQYINSGLNGFLNDFYKFLSTAWDMDFQKTYSEAFEAQHEATITAFFIVIGFAVMILLNFVFNNEQSPLTVFFIIFPILQMGMYFDETPGVIAMVLIIIAIVACFVFRHNYQFSLPTGKKDVRRVHYKHNHYYLHYSNGRVVLQVFAVVSAAIIAVFSVVSVIFPASSHKQNEALMEAKESTVPTVRQVLLYGLAGLFNRGGGSGGVSLGNLGAYGTVYSDYQTDLKVTFAPYTYEAIYLKSKVGVNYYGTSWKNIISDSILTEDYYTDYGFDSYADVINFEANHLKELKESDKNILSGKMNIQVVDYSLGYSYLAFPYYTLFEFEDNKYLASELATYSKVPYANGGGSERTLEYYVYQDVWNSSYATAPISTNYDQFIHDNYTCVWGVGDSYGSIVSDTYNETDRKNVVETLKKFCTDNNFHGTTKEIIEQIQALFERDYLYTLNPGVTPSNQDFVVNFLTKSKKGYCTYFASAATLLLRTMDIPARYVCGYVVTMDDVVDGTILENERYEDWLQGEAAVGKTGVVEAEINDSKLHAWVEVYLNGYGWVPVEFTTAAVETSDDNNYSALWSSIAGGMDGSDATANVIEAVLNSDAGKVISVIFRIICAAALVAALVFIAGRIKKYRDRVAGKVSFYEGDNAQAVKCYRALIKYLKKRKLCSGEEVLVSRLIELLKGKVDEESLMEFKNIYNKAAYSQEGISREELNRFKKIISVIREKT